MVEVEEEVCAIHPGEAAAEAARAASNRSRRRRRNKHTKQHRRNYHHPHLHSAIHGEVLDVIRRTKAYHLKQVLAVAVAVAVAAVVDVEEVAPAMGECFLSSWSRPATRFMKKHTYIDHLV